MTPAQIDFLRDFAIDNLPRAQADRIQVSRKGGDLYTQLAFTAVMVRGKASTTAIEYAAANVLESVCLLQQSLSTKHRADTLHNLVNAANNLCLQTGTTIPWLAAAVLEPELEQAQPAPPAKPLPSIAGRSFSTSEAAELLGFKEQTLRQWASSQSGPIQPTKVARRLKWSGDDILAVLRSPFCISTLSNNKRSR